MSVYINPIAIGIMVSLCIIYLAFIPLVIHQYRKYGTARMRGNVVIASFIVYMITAWFMTILPLPPIEAVQNMGSVQPNFKPFLLIETFLNQSGFIFTQPGTWFAAICSSSFFTVAFNVVLTIPFGVYLRKYFKLSLPWVAVLGLLLSLFYEVTQYTGLYGIYPHAYRLADVDDLIVNTLGAIIGYFLEGWLDNILPNPAKDHAIISNKVSLLRRVLSFVVDAIAINIVFEFSRVIIYWNTNQRKLDLVIFLASEAVVFLLFPILTKNKQTVGMLAMKIFMKDRTGQNAKTSRILLHNLLVGAWPYFMYGAHEIKLNYALETFFELILMILILVMIVKSLIQKKFSYYWEPWFDTYLKANLPVGKTLDL
jgi:glycopeptide antibiotics resistance protein